MMNYALPLIIQQLIYSSASQGVVLLTVAKSDEKSKLNPLFIDTLFNSVFIQSGISGEAHTASSGLLKLHLRRFKYADVKNRSSVYKHYLQSCAELNLNYDPPSITTTKPRVLIAYKTDYEDKNETLVLYGTIKNHTVFSLTGILNNLTGNNDYEITVRGSWSKRLDTMEHYEMKQLAFSLSKTALLSTCFQGNDEKILKGKLQRLLTSLAETQKSYQQTSFFIMAGSCLLKALQTLGNGLLFCFCGSDQQDSRSRAHSY